VKDDEKERSNVCEKCVCFVVGFFVRWLIIYRNGLRYGNVDRRAKLVCGFSV